MPAILQDVRFACVALARRPLFTGAALAALALGIGANAAVFSVVNGVLLRPLPFEDPGRLVAVWPGRAISNAELVYLQRHARAMREVAAFSPGWGIALTGSGEPRQLTGARTSTNFFTTLGVRPALGRTFIAGESTPGSDRVVVLGDALWRSQFGADPAVLGRTVTLDGDPHTVIGVMPRGFEAFAHDVDAWLPLVIDPSSSFHRGPMSIAFGRLAEGATIDRAQLELQGFIPEIRRELEFPDDYGRDSRLVPLHEHWVGDLRTTLLVLLGAVTLIVLIAGANLGNLLLLRASVRRREIAVRTALGASRSRIIRLLLAESVVLAGVGGGLGLAAAVLGVAGLKRLLPPDIPRLAGIGVDFRVVAACAVVTIAVGVVFGLAPAVIASRNGGAASLRTGAATAGASGGRLRDTLVIGEIALALTLVVGAGLMLQTLWRLGRVDPGFDAEDVVTLRLQPSGRIQESAEYPIYFDAMIDRVRAVPGVASAGAIHHVPLTGFNWNGALEIEGRPSDPRRTPPSVTWRAIAGDYFEAMGIELVRGRRFGATDHADAPPTVIINESMARRYWGSADPLGARIKAGGGTFKGWATIVGVTRDVRFDSLSGDARSEIYRPAAQQPRGSMYLVIRARAGDPLRLVPAIRSVIRAADADVPIAEVRALDQLVSASVARPRTIAVLLAAFASVGVVLGVVGIYGVVAYGVSQRTREFGIRLALGAAQRSVLALVVGRGLRLAAAGVVLGTIASLAAARSLQSLVYGVRVTDPMTYGVLAAGLVAVALAASYIPARRAATTDPAITLREEG